MKEKILSFIKKRKSTDISRYLPIDGERWFDTYFFAIKNALRRAWNWKFMWFWAIFIGGGYGSLNFNGGSEVSDSLSEDVVNGLEFSTDPTLFFVDSMVWFIAGVVVILFVVIIFWILSCVSRWGLIRSISEIQDNGKPKSDKIMEVWKKGENGLGRIFLLDIIVALFWLIVVGVIVAIVGISSYALSQFIDAIFVFVFFILTFLPLFFLLIAFSTIVKYVVSISTVIMVLENSRPIKSIKKAVHLLIFGYREVGKIFLMRILLSFISIGSGFVFFSFFLCIGIFIAVPFIVAVIMQHNIFENIVFSLISSGVFIIYLVFFISSIIIITIILKLTFLDLWVWWVKRNMPRLREGKAL